MGLIWHGRNIKNNLAKITLKEVNNLINKLTLRLIWKNFKTLIVILAESILCLINLKNNLTVLRYFIYRSFGNPSRQRRSIKNQCYNFPCVSLEFRVEFTWFNFECWLNNCNTKKLWLENLWCCNSTKRSSRLWILLGIFCNRIFRKWIH
jgi:hypothetical protein